MDWLKKILGQNGDKKEITLDAQKIAKLYYLATVDTKTQLYNYRYFNSSLKHELAISERYGRPLSLMLIDIDDFKKINDAHGYLRGDEILQLVATIIKSNIRETDIAARFGGEEFVVLMPETKEEEAEKMAERLRGLIMADKFLFNYHVTVSIGVAQNFPIEKENIEMKSLYSRFMPKNKEKENKDHTLFEKANVAIKYAKEHGKNKVIAFSRISKNAFLENIKRTIEIDK
ncbi:MAG: GGDEF domain-containing protein [Candidatus Pacearchaeota archaeon]|nr:GGDEF domain-containing protein [Candidatus Pacearchaeota archaeon]